MTTVNRELLLDSALDFANRALKAYTENDTRVILVNAAISLEHLSKTYLCNMNPALLVELRNGSLDSLLHLTGHGDKAAKKFPRTISAREAIERLKKIIPNFMTPERINDLINIRDGVVHTGFLDEKATKEILVAALRVSNELFEALSVPEHVRWGRHSDLVDSLISQSLNEIQRDVKHRMAAAKLRIEEILARIPEYERGSVMLARQAQAFRVIMESERMAAVTCPVCGEENASYIGQVSYEPDEDVESDGEDGYNTTILGVTAYLKVSRFVCGCCELRLENRDELDAAGLESELVSHADDIRIADDPETEWWNPTD
ncbi:hypothetical protein AB0C84_15835 [Actinomadura sp. NPDC048955]|uniref:hypothetical protein n=1 Tax=Actinomadura sp. NPDC048955 TaxID=3158228 RepID=UPI0033E3A97E